MSNAYLDKLAAEAGVTMQLKEIPLLTYYAYVDKDGNELGIDDVIDIALAHLVQKAGDVMKARCAYMVERQRTGLNKEHAIQLREAEYTIRALPGVTVDDLK